MSFTINNKVALITGANRGIGKAIAEYFLCHGVGKVYAAVRNLNSVNDLVQQYGSRVVPLYVDINKPNSIAQLALRSQDVHLIINNAGILAPSSILDENSEEALMSELTVNTFGLIRIAKAFSTILQHNRGALVQLNSIGSLKSFPALSTYCASKAASYSITQSLKNEFADKGVRIISVHPGPIATDMGKLSGMIEMAKPAVIVAEAIVKALALENFHVFPDPIAKEFENAYHSYAQNMIEA